jgi:hypothetical protein
MTADTEAARVAGMLSEAQIHILRHSLGVPDPGQTNMYRNHFVTGEGSLDHPDCMALVEAGLMTRHRGNPVTGDMDLFLVNDAGKRAVRQHLQEQTDAL